MTKVRGLHDQQVAAQSIEHALCRVPDQQPLKSGARDGPHDEHLGSRGANYLLDDIHDKALLDVAMALRNPHSIQYRVKGIMSFRVRLLPRFSDCLGNDDLAGRHVGDRIECVDGMHLVLYR